MPECSICSAPPEVLKAVNDCLSKKMKFLDIARLVGKSKSAVGRHSLKCLNKIKLAAFRNRFFNPELGRVYVRYDDEPATKPARPFTKNDVIVHVHFEPDFEYDRRIQSEVLAFRLATEENIQRSKKDTDNAS